MNLPLPLVALHCVEKLYLRNYSPVHRHSTRRCHHDPRHASILHPSGYKVQKPTEAVKSKKRRKRDVTNKMGKSAQVAAAILERVLQFLFNALKISTLVVLKAIRNDAPKQIPFPKHPELLKSASDLATEIRKRATTSERVVEIFISRIEEINPLLNFVVKERFVEALKEAKQIDKFLKETQLSEDEIKEKTPFLGVPFTVKESLAVKGMSHTAGVLSRKHIIANENSEIVSAIVKAGAIPIIVTNTPEVCCWWETYNPLHGRTNNPYDTTRTAGGSSGGEGAVIAAAGSTFGLGSDFAGSIRVPAAFNGIFGHRPTSQTSSIDGHYPIPANKDLRTMLITGPLTRYASDLRPLIKIITEDIAPDLDLSTPVDLKSLTVYYMEEADMFLTTSVQPAIKTAICKTAQHFQKLGARIERLRLKDMRYAMMYWYATVKTNDGPQLGKELANHKGSVSIITEFCKTLIGASQHTLPIILFGMLESANGIPYKGRLHSGVLNKYQQFKEDLNKILGENCILIMPAHPTTALKHGEALARSMDLGYSAIINVLGFPSTCCPVSRDESGLPVGVQVVANLHQDRLTLAAAEEIERAFGGWSPPYVH